MSITVKNVWKSFGGEAVLRDVSFAVPDGTVTCVMAPSGRGKTTLLRLLLGLERPDSGSVETEGPCRWSAVFQEDRLLEHLDAAGNLRFALGSGYDPAEAAALLTEVGLEGVGGKLVREYSGGMKRRLALVRALLADFDALVLDEPFTGLDRESREKCLAAIRKRTAGKPVLLVTHEEAEARELGARIIRL